ncbi:outer membrane beta-barrel protein [Solilutibacter silvestris]|uniref:Outer membrane protein beta-barrel domain n=1 Tax=Solilutibacter silvestris TaxID=1645665 RepID=A0A2K1Q1H6_9GAMM|nr:outer membrane beta-barrel protein [Lysobacter silvestris]PNS08777.1 Outer membrane protein beta-barrel domain [Lysobacter silvestris]
MKKIQTTVVLTTLAAALGAPAAFAQSATTVTTNTAQSESTTATSDSNSGESGQAFIRSELGKTQLKQAGADNKIKDTSGNIRGGYMFNHNIGVEGFYGRYYDKTDKHPGYDGNTKLDGVGAGVVGKVRVGDQARDTGFYASGRTGMMRSSYKQSISADNNGTTTEFSRTSHSNQPYYGVGVGYDISRNTGVGVNYDYFQGKSRSPVTGNKENFNARTVGVDLEHRF